MNLFDYHKEYIEANSCVTFFHWLEGYVPSISDLATKLGCKSIDDLKKLCKDIQRLAS